MTRAFRLPAGCLPAALVLLATGAPLGAQTGAPGGEWPTYGGDLGHTRYAALDQIDAGNFDELEIAWRFKTDNLGPVPEYQFQSTPLMVNGVVYTTAGSRRAVAALDAGTGELLWTYSLHEGARGEAAPRRLSGRGLAYWSDGSDERILYVTPGYRLIALAARTGRPVPGFGQDGIVDLKLNNDQDIDPVTGEVGLHATPTVAGDVVIVGAAFRTGGNPRSRRNTKGYVRGFDVRTGERLWIFHTIPQPGEFGRETWLNDSAVYTGNTGVWAQISVDEELGIAYLPVEAPTSDYYGGHRPGANLFAESLVALDLATGERVWHFQIVHHGLWDYDLPAAPNLLDVTVDGRPIKAVAQITKQGFTFVFDRATGEPVWPIEERPVPTDTDIEGEVPWPTQPFPTRPAPFDYQGVAIDDLVDFTPEIRQMAIEAVAPYRIGPLYTPHSLRGTVVRPGFSAGSWGGAAVDPETGLLYVPSAIRYTVKHFRAPEPGEDTSLALLEARGALTHRPQLPQGLPLFKPPYSRMTAIDMNTGEHVWMRPMGDGDRIRNLPLLRDLDLPPLGGDSGRVGPVLTKTLLIYALTAGGTGGGPRLVAFDKTTGAEIASVDLPGGAIGTPMTYLSGGRQYIALTVGGGRVPELIALALPQTAGER